ncbi:hypothetical protein [uncultured Oscillibacter sp.]|uniref:hypothetical protein n=1 Tax=uncultured Oscillibacter sp. TaxID=876091 RepID=UPI0025EE575E|nr:hypothetical protein [uncultured Oscillibacter sp.]
MKKKHIISGVLSLSLVLCMSVPAFAADVSTAGGSGAVPIPLTVAAATFSVTVPTSLPINVDTDGNVTTATNLKIVNNGHGAVKVTNMSVKGIEDWQIVSYDNANMVSEKVNAHKIAMAINGDKTTADDTITFSSTNFPKLDGANATNSDELTITYNAKVPAQATTLDNVKVVEITFVIGWDA